MIPLLDTLDAPLFRVLGGAVTVVGLLGFVVGALVLVAVARERTWNWPLRCAGALVVLAAAVGVGLYGFAAVAGTFVALGGYGWWRWRRAARRRGPDSKIAPATKRQLAYGVVLTAFGTVVVAFLLATETTAIASWLLGFAISAAAYASWAQATRLLEQWWACLAAGAAWLAASLAQGDVVEAAGVVLLLVLSAAGLRRWRRVARDARALEQAHVTVDDPQRDVESERVSA